MARLLFANAAFIALALVPASVRASNYYIDSRTGSDAADGRSPRTAWRGLERIGTGSFAPGDSILFARGAQFTGGFVFRASGSAARPIVFAPYGTGSAPAFSNPEYAVLNGNIFRIEGSHVVISGLYFHDNTNPPPGENAHHEVQKLGAVYLGTRADSNVISDCEFARSPVGIKVKGSYNLVTRNHLHDATTPMGKNWGAIAIMIVSPHNEVSYNRIERYGYFGGAYGSDGGAIELDGVDDAFDPRDISVHHNISIENHGFIELAGRGADSITIAYNLSDDVDKFLGGGSMKHVLIDHNTVIRTREPNIDRWIFWTFDRDNSSMTVTNNIFVVPRDIQVFPQGPKPVGHKRTGLETLVRSNNLYFSPAGAADLVGLPLADGDVVADPKFIGADFRLAPDSPARRLTGVAGYLP